MKQQVSRNLIQSLVKLSTMADYKRGGYRTKICLNLQDGEIVATNGVICSRISLVMSDIDNLSYIFGKELDKGETIALASADCSNLKSMLKNKAAIFYVLKDEYNNLEIRSNCDASVHIGVYNNFPNYGAALPVNVKNEEFKSIFAIKISDLKDLLEAMVHSDSKEITFKFIDDRSPIVVNPGSTDNPGNVRNVIMPIKLS